MNKNLPNVFAVPIEKKIENNKETFVSSMKEVAEEERVDLATIDKIFNAKDHVYKTHVHIKTKEGIIDAQVIGRTNKSLLTLDGKKISLEEILEIKKV